MVPSFTGGSSTPFLVSPCVWAGGRRPEGAVPRPVQRTVRRGAPVPAGPRLPISPPQTPDRKVPTGAKRGSERCSPPEHGGRGKNPKKIRNPWQPPTAPASLTSRTARRERGAGPYTFSPGGSPMRAKSTRRAHFTPFPPRAPEARISSCPAPRPTLPTRALRLEERPVLALTPPTSLQHPRTRHGRVESLSTRPWAVERVRSRTEGASAVPRRRR